MKILSAKGKFFELSSGLRFWILCMIITQFFFSSLYAQNAETETMIRPDVLVANDYFGQKAAIDGDIAAIASFSVVYVFRWNGAEWIQEAELTSASLYNFGNDLDLSGETIVVSGWEYGPNEDSMGHLFVFQKTDTK